MENDGLPKDPMTKLVQGAATMHELYLSYQSGGFTPTEALYLIGVLLTEAVKQQRPPD